MSSKKKVLVTGFGPFGEHTVNASWVAVQRLAEMGISDNVEIVIEEIPVDYKKVKEIIPKLWGRNNPDLVIHVGVSGIAEEITLEQLSHNDGYNRQDINGTCPANYMCLDDAEECKMSGIDMERVCDDINNSDEGIQAIVSTDPGRYLCDFSYYISLNINHTCSAFIHVPPLDEPYSAKQLAQGLRLAIISMLRQIS